MGFGGNDTFKISKIDEYLNADTISRNIAARMCETRRQKIKIDRWNWINMKHNEMEHLVWAQGHALNLECEFSLVKQRS